MTHRSTRGKKWDKANWCTAIITPPVGHVAPYQCINNGIHDGLCSVHVRKKQKKEARAAKKMQLL